jgi:hypothetical protein
MINEWVYLRWQRGTRYYEVHLHQDLWGDWVLTQVWGRRGTELGRMVQPPALPMRRAASGWLRFGRDGSNEATQS